MQTEETHIVNTYGKQQPFRVPQGYFDSLTSNIMANLPERPTHAGATPNSQKTNKPHNTIYRYLRPALAIAASFLLITFTAYTFFVNKDEASTTLRANGGYGEADSYTEIDQTADYVMMDNEDMYAYVAGY